MGKKKKKDMMRLERESVIPILKSRLINTLSYNLESKSESESESKSESQVVLIISIYFFLLLLLIMKIMDKSNFKLTTDDEIEVALSAQYRLNLPIIVDESKLDKRLLTRYFTKHPKDDLPHFADKYIIFRRGIGIDHTTAYFIQAKVNTIILRIWRFFLKVTGLKRIVFGTSSKNSTKYASKNVDISIEDEQDDLYVERIRIEKMKLMSIIKLLSRITIQEPTFDRIIVVYRRAKTKKENERGIYVKHFKNIPMADLEIVLPEKKNPSLTPMDWVKFLVSAAIGLATVVSSISIPKADIRVIFAVLSAVIGYCIKTYFSFQKNLVAYQSLITQSVYNKQLDSGRGTLLHLCDEVIQQEVKEVIISFSILREYGKSTKQDLDKQCEQLIKDEFGERCDFDVDDAVQKLEKLGIVSRDDSGRYSCVELKQANEIIGITTEEVVLKATEGEGFTENNLPCPPTEGRSLEGEEESAQDYIDIIRKKIVELERTNLFNDDSHKEELEYSL
ncbi:hypothetical protein TIFTF001_026484 [Ficus carica]|uniref:Aminopeptidase n=1 Tax=Ficus carica TaxID=3494 RepID=A0AA88IY55_FICCA|nr:hypothetical protein TIFTF001_026484 [Ficus carica]